ncbi:hypothetical protein HDU81_008519 [Chytriomyces hyalinus]|nr:hypothetical protein HDU81_008519 [Chytriomyces hyalinus]
MRSSAPHTKEEDWPMEGSPPMQLTTDLHTNYSFPFHPAYPSYPINLLSETSSVSSNDSCQMDVTCLQRLHFEVDKRPFPSILPLVQPMETLHEEHFSLRESVKDELDFTHFWVGSPRAAVAFPPPNHNNTFFFKVSSPSPVMSPLASPYPLQSGGFATQERVSTVSTETLVHEHRSSQSSLMYSGQPPLLQFSPNKEIRHRDSAQTLSKSGQGSMASRSSPVIQETLMSEESLLVVEAEEDEKEPSSWQRMFKKTVRKDTTGSKESVATLYSLTLNRESVQESVRDSVKSESDRKQQVPENKPENKPKGFRRFLKKTASFFRSNSKTQKKAIPAETSLKMDSKLHGPEFNLSNNTNSALNSSLSFEPQTKNVSPPSTLTNSFKKDSNSSVITQPQATPRKSTFGSVDNEPRDQTRFKPTDSPIVSNETMESLDRGRMTWKLMGQQTSQLKNEYLCATALAKNESLLASYSSSLLRPSNASSLCGTGGRGAGSQRDYYASSDGESRYESMDRSHISTPVTDSGTKTASYSHLPPQNGAMQRNNAGQCRAGNALATLDPRLSQEHPDSTNSKTTAEKLATSGRSRSSPAVVISIGGFQDLKLTVGVELAKLYYDICVSGLDVDEIAERAASGEYLNDEEEED